MKQTIEVIWFKRDLRTEDHQPLVDACLSATADPQSSCLILPIYIIEPEIWQTKQVSLRHWHFIYQSLIELDQDLRLLGQPLQVMHGSAVSVFEDLFQKYQVNALRSHQETGTAESFNRDLAVKKLCHQKSISWFEIPQHSVQRGFLNRDHYSAIMQSFFTKPPLEKPSYIQPQAIALKNAISEQHLWKTNPYLELEENTTFYAFENTQQGGRKQGLSLLNSFLGHRHRKYLANISKPLGGDIFSSRLSAHLAYGTLSIREVMFYTQQANQTLSQQPQIIQNSHRTDNPQSRQKSRGLPVFQQRLFWQSHFIQKLETEPNIEFQAMHPAYQNIRSWDKTAQHHYQAWSQGLTGFPMIDAAMRCLHKTGWLPFRMRALLVSFASYQLWIPWQKTAHHLARLFTDYEPGIHYSQIQMQSGTTGINAIRIYNPIKQSQEHDANGAFIRKWCPELNNLDNHQIHTPWEHDLINNAAGLDYPAPIVDLEEATKRAKDKIYGIKNGAHNKKLSQAVFQKHGSRNSPERRAKRVNSKNKVNLSAKANRATKTNPPINEQQLTLF